MYERQRMNMDVLHELMMEDDGSNPIPYSQASGILQTPSSYTRFNPVLNDTFMTTQAGSSYALPNVGPSGVQSWAQTASSTSKLPAYDDDDDDDYDDDDDDDDDDDISLDSNSNVTAAATCLGQNVKASQQKQRKVQQPKQKLPVPAYTDSRVTSLEQKQRKLPGPRPSRSLEEMTPLEAERRRRRRERNKNAAAKCRQRRVEQTNTLLAKTEELEQESGRLEREIESLRRMKNQLEYVLDAHKPTCTATFANIKTEKPEAISLSVSSAIRPSNLPISTVPTTCRSSLMTSFDGVMTSSANVLDGMIFSFDTPTTLVGLTPMMMPGELGSPSSLVMLSPSLIAQQ